MLSIPSDLFPQYIFPTLSKQDLYCLSLCCTTLKDIAHQEIITRTIAVSNILKNSIDLFLEREIKIFKFEGRQKVSLDFFYHHFLSNVKKELIEDFHKLQELGKKGKFLANMDCPKNLKPECTELIEDLENSSNGPSRFCYINIGKKFLTPGNIAWFSMINKENQIKKEEILDLDSYGSEAHFNKSGHLLITFFEDPVDPFKTEEISQELLTQLESNIGSLKELRLLNITLASKEYTPQMRTCFNYLLTGASDLPFLKCLYCSFSHRKLDLQIEDLTKYVNERLVVKQHSLCQLFIYCNEISSPQITHFVESLHTILDKVQKSIILNVQISLRTCTHVIPPNADLFYNTERVSVRIIFKF